MNKLTDLQEFITQEQMKQLHSDDLERMLETGRDFYFSIPNTFSPKLDVLALLNQLQSEVERRNEKFT